MATAIINVLPCKLLKWKSPHSILFGEEPYYSSFKVFGCQCYYNNPSPHKDKFEPRAFQATLLGFSIGQKGWNLDAVTGKVVVSKNLRFQETIFLFD